MEKLKALFIIYALLVTVSLGAVAGVWMISPEHAYIYGAVLINLSSLFVVGSFLYGVVYQRDRSNDGTES